MDTLLSDLRFAGRLLWKDKAFALTALLTLAICIGANTAIFSVVHSVLLRPLPVPQSERIVITYNRYPKAGVDRAATGVPDYFDRLRETSVFSEQAMYQQRGATVGTDIGAERMTALTVTPSFFRLLRVPVHRGRAFADEDGETGNDRKVILSYSLWQRLFSGDDGAIGKDLRIGGEPFTIVGVMPDTFRFVQDEVRLWVPAAFTPQQRSDDSRHSNNWTMIARLKDDATIELARQQIDALNARNLDRFPSFKQVLIDAGFDTRVAFLQDDIVAEISGVLYLLWGGVLFVLLIGAVNITNLVLVRSNVRMREIATRQALGAGRGRVARQMLTETTLLTVAGGGLGLLLGRWTLGLLSGMGLDALPRGSEVALDRTVVLFVMALSAVVGVLIGVIPIVNAARADLNGVLREEGRSGTSGRSARFVRRALVTAQVALAFVLLVGASLLLASFRKVLALDPGLDPHSVLTANVSLPATQYRDDAQARAFMDRAMERVRSLPGVEAAGLTTNVPFGGNYNDGVILAEGYAAKPGESLVSPTNAVVSSGYFEAMRIPLVRGRLFNASDQPGAMRAIIIDEQLAARYWPGADPIGRRMFRPNNPQSVMDPGPNVEWLTIVGVVASVRQRGLLDPQNDVGAYYFPIAQSSARAVTFVLRTAGDPQAMAASLRNAVRDLDPELPVFGVRTMEERVAMTLVGRRTPMLLGLGFGTVALFLSALGIYGVLAYQVAQRTREIGIRMALGSSARGILGLVLREGAVMLAFGLAIGLAGALALGRAMQTLLFNVAPTNPLVLSSGAAALAVVALIGSALPARRAARINPATALCE